jgi:hypothetical protein
MIQRSVALTALAAATMFVSLPASSADKPAFNPDAQACAEIVWREDILSKYPKVDLACDDVVERGGKRYVKFRAEVIEQTKDGIKLQFPRTGYVTDLKIADKSKEIYVGDKARRLSSLKKGDDIRVYVPSDRFVVSFLDERIAELGEGMLSE